MHVVFQLTSALCHAQFAMVVEEAGLKGRVQELQAASAGAVKEYIAREKKVSFSELTAAGLLQVVTMGAAPSVAA